MHRRQFLMSAAAAAGASAAPAQRPNILLIMTDQQTHDAWGGASNPWLRTPAMDSLAARGVTFSRAHCPYPVCSPSRSSIFTGRMAHETGVMVNGLPITPGMATMGEVFRSAGYETVYGGKWHLPKSFDGMTGFERLIGGHGLGSKMDAPLAEACSGWLRKREAANSKDPFLMVASFMNPHDICQWIRDHPGAREHADVRRYPPAPGNMAIDPEEPEVIRFHRTAGYDLMSKAVGIASEWHRDDIRQYLHDYYRMVEAVDAEIGRVLLALEETGLATNTIVAFCSDHGEGMGAHRWVQKAAFWEETVRVPLLFAGPGIPAGRVCSDLANLTDLLPTFCDFAGISPPPDLRGVSLRSAMTGTALDRPFVVSELRYLDENHEGRMLRTRRYKYVVFNSGARPEQLFDLQVDPGETQNLARAGAAESQLASHRDQLRAWLRSTGDSFQPEKSRTRSSN
jgi:arylsulfatase A-like enzyme